MAFSNATENDVLNAMFNGGTFSMTPYLSLHTADPGETGGNEETGGSYGRVEGSAKFADSANGTVVTDQPVTWTGLPAGTWTHVGVYTAATGGVYRARAALAEPITLPAGSSLTLPAGSLTFTLD